MFACRSTVRALGVLIEKNRFPNSSYASRTDFRFSRSFRALMPVREAHPRNTPSSNSRLSGTPEGMAREDEGSLSFTRTSLYKLALPLKLPSADRRMAEMNEVANPEIDRGESDNHSQKADKASDRDGENSADNSLDKPERRRHLPHSAKTNTQTNHAQNVIFLLHSGQPLSYIANLIRAEEAHIEPTNRSEDFGESAADPTGQPPITFYTSRKKVQRWSPATGIGDFLREAAHEGNFTIYIGNQRIRVNVPSFEERTRFLRASLHAKTAHIERLALLKGECDRMARKAAQRMAFAGAGVLCAWWVTVGVLTFNTPLGWDTMEPVTYLTGHGMLIWGYLWFLWHNREVSYRTVLTESTSRRQHKLYAERAFDAEAYHELVSEAKHLRHAIKRVAWDYGIDWDQGKTEDGKTSRLALDVVRKEEAKDRKVKKNINDDESEEDEALDRADDDGNARQHR